jgi:hypothetical protein
MQENAFSTGEEMIRTMVRTPASTLPRRGALEASRPYITAMLIVTILLFVWVGLCSV